MKQFFKFLLASVLGVLISFLAIVLLLIIVVSSVSKPQKIRVEENTILVASFDKPITERSPAHPFLGFGLSSFTPTSMGLNDILANIRKAKADERIKGIYLDITLINAGMATLEDIRNALLDFKETGKFIIAFGEVYTSPAYYLASVADKIYIYPEGDFIFSGMSTETVFLKGTLDKLDIEAQVFQAGIYKSPVESLVQYQMSVANREQVSGLLESVYGHFLNKIGKARDIPADSLFRIANELAVRQPEHAVKLGLADGTRYKDEVLDELKELTGVPEKEELKAVSINQYTQAESPGNEEKPAAKRIAVVYASGDILGGEGTEQIIGSDLFSRTIRKLRRDDKIKGIVLRVNSPGGDALSSDVILREVKLAEQEKPVVVSMSDQATSGGYYIASGATKIMAQPNTITGSIGVYGVIFNAQGFLNKHAGISFDGVKTGNYADLGRSYLGFMNRPLTAAEKQIIQHDIDDIYQNFITHVAEGRHLAPAYVDSIGQGHVWSGADALEIGLVDTLGGVSDAISLAAELAGIENYSVREFPERGDPVEEFLRQASGSVKTFFLKEELGETLPYFQKIQKLRNVGGIQARMPYDITFN